MAVDIHPHQPGGFVWFSGGSEPPAQWSPIRWFWWFSLRRRRTTHRNHLSSTKTPAPTHPRENHPTGADR